MAETSQEVQKLNKNVEEALKILRTSMGNSAQINATNEKQREAINKWFKTTEMAQDHLKKNEQVAEEESKKKKDILKKEEDQSKKFFFMANAIKKGFSIAFIKTGEMLKNVSASIVANVKNIFSQLQSQFVSLFGEESEWFGLLSAIKDSVMGFFGWFVRGFLFIFKRPPAYAMKGIRLLQNIVSMMKKETKLSMLGEKAGKGRKGGVIGLIASILGAIGGAVGAVGGFISRIPILGRALKILRVGFKKLFLPLTIILAAYDFIKGFLGTEGSLLEKIEGGYRAAIHGLIDIPLRLIGWIVEKAAGLFGIKLTGVGDKLVKLADKLLTVLFIPFKVIGTLVGRMVEFAKQYEIVDKLSSALNTVIEFIKNLWNSIVDWLHSPAARATAKFFGVELPEKIDLPQPETSPMAAANEYEKRKIRERQRQHQEQINIAKESADASKESARKSDTSLQTIAAMQQSNGGGQTIIREPRQVPDESDNVVLGIKNLAMEME